ncbi:MAG TPA: hypothetical protein VM012_12460 [Flavitalea sp.]|nr:hypothetical protein [Flavitalea sp.]
MKKHSTQQEILLLTGTSFSSREICDNSEPVNQKRLTEIERLEEACWNGLLAAMLPEIYPEGDAENPIYLWKVREGDSFLEIDLGNIQEEKDNFFSIDPYTFLKTQLLS